MSDDKVIGEWKNVRYPDPKSPVWQTPIVPIGVPHGKGGWFDHPKDLTPAQEAAIAAVVTPMPPPPVDYDDLPPLEDEE